MRVYVAGRWTRKTDVRDVQRMLRERGHEITHDWTAAEDPPSEWNEERRRAYMAEQAHGDLKGVLSAEAVVVLDDPTGCGLFVELGVAIASPRAPTIVVVAPPPRVGSCVFYFLRDVQVVSSAEAAVALLPAGGTT